MNIFLKSFLAAIVVSVFCFFVLINKNRRKLYNATIILEPDRSRVGRRTFKESEKQEVFEKIDERASVLSSKRKLSYNEYGKLRVDLFKIADTSGIADAFVSTSNLEIWEMYMLNDVLQGFEKTNTFLLKDDTLATAKKPKADTVSRSGLLSEIPETKDEEAEKKGLYSILKFDKSLSGLESVLGVIKVVDTAKLFSLFRNPAIRSFFPADIVFVLGKSDYGTAIDNSSFVLHAIKTYNQPDRPFLTNKDLKDAYQDYNSQTGKPVVIINLNQDGADTWEKLTERNVGKPLALMLDDLVVSAPVVQSKISGGNIEIAGGYTVEEAATLAAQLKSGGLPVPLRINNLQIKKDNAIDRKIILLTLLCMVLGFGCAWLIFYMLKPTVYK